MSIRHYVPDNCKEKPRGKEGGSEAENGPMPRSSDGRCEKIFQISRNLWLRNFLSKVELKFTDLCCSSFSSGFLKVLSLPCLETTLFLLQWAWITLNIPDLRANGFHLWQASYIMIINGGGPMWTCYWKPSSLKHLEEFRKMLDCKHHLFLPLQMKPLIKHFKWSHQDWSSRDIVHQNNRAHTLNGWI